MAALLKAFVFRRQFRVGLLFALAPILPANLAQPQDAAASAASINTSQIVEAMERHDRAQAERLRRYHAVRHYSIVYRGFARTIAASMEVEVDYESTSGKSFRVISQDGSATLCQKVLKRALDSEKEASQDKASTALTPANYKFQFVGADRLGNRSAYILEVEPITPTKFLYRGRIWVDAADFAVAKMEVQPAKNPSFWISRTVIHHTNGITNGFWLPEQNRSETKVRIGGAAVMTIDYGTYQVTPQADAPKPAPPRQGR